MSRLHRAIAALLLGILLGLLPDFIMAGGIPVIVAIALLAIAAWIVASLHLEESNFGPTGFCLNRLNPNSG